MTQRELARRAGIEQKTLSRIEGSEMKLVSAHLRRIGNVLGFEVPDPLGEVLERTVRRGNPVPLWDRVEAGKFAGVDPQS